MADLDNIVRLLEDIRQELLVRNLQKLNPQQILIVDGLSDISKRLGLVQSGEFRTGNGLDPGKGFTGVRMGFPSFLYSTYAWHLAGVNNDVIQFGLSADDGTAWAGGGAIRMTSGGILVYNDATQTGAIESDGDVKFGNDISAPASTTLCIFTNAQTYNGESVSGGDLLIGNNSAGKPNLFWDKSAGELQFRIGTTRSGYLNAGGFTQVACKVDRSTVQSISNSTYTAIDFTSEIYDDNNFADLTSNANRITIPSGQDGVYTVGSNIAWGSNAVGYRGAFLMRNTDVGAFAASVVTAVNGYNTTLNFVEDIALVAGDYIYTNVVQTSGGNLNVWGNMYVRKIR